MDNKDFILKHVNFDPIQIKVEKKKDWEQSKKEVISTIMTPVGGGSPNIDIIIKHSNIKIKGLVTLQEAYVIEEFCLGAEAGSVTFKDPKGFYNVVVVDVSATASDINIYSEINIEMVVV